MDGPPGGFSDSTEERAWLNLQEDEGGHGNTLFPLMF
jgi:hypothetical protein